ncbi:DUF4421 family protein [Chryseolinea sp. T2]|uniref:DUF4421 family protein n=1 Tax=Chryseolinea sp. T2 TaxID=3129255 RepID=UPI0030777B17
MNCRNYKRNSIITTITRRGSIAIILQFLTHFLLAQNIRGTRAVTDADSVYIRTFLKKNDIRIFYGGQGNRLVLGSLRDGSPDLTRNIYHNTNDFIGVGISYKWLDGDAYFSLPGTTYLKEERSNLDQFRLAGSYTRRRISFRGYISDSKGVIISGNQDEYQSPPSIHEFLAGLQATYIFNESKYSYRAALYQNERQMTTAGSFLIRGEIFYRSLGANGQPLIPEAYDVETRFGPQTGLEYLRAPGLIIMPGYGMNFVFNSSRLFISPILLAGAGAAFNTYKTDTNKGTHVNMEYDAYFLLNVGYNGRLWYGRIQSSYGIGYSKIQPTYLTSANLMFTLLAGYRFYDLSKAKRGGL